MPHGRLWHFCLGSPRRHQMSTMDTGATTSADICFIKTSRRPTPNYICAGFNMECSPRFSRPTPPRTAASCAIHGHSPTISSWCATPYSCAMRSCHTFTMRHAPTTTPAWRCADRCTTNIPRPTKHIMCPSNISSATT